MALPTLEFNDLTVQLDYHPASNADGFLRLIVLCDDWIGDMDRRTQVIGAWSVGHLYPRCHLSNSGVVLSIMTKSITLMQKRHTVEGSLILSRGFANS
jgi:hypothetical protein